jgi:thymidylate synthase ThyX
VSYKKFFLPQRAFPKGAKMTTISAKIITDSASSVGKRLTTLALRYPLVIHAEIMTHRVFSRNARSSRAVPTLKLIQECIDDPFVPLHWGKAQPGMQAYEECDELVPRGWNGMFQLRREEAWLSARDASVESAQAFHKAGYAKQIVNRLLTPFLHIDTLVTATEWDNFFELRLHHAAEPHMQMLAEAIKKAMDESIPKLLGPGEWHLPYADDEATKEQAMNFGSSRDINSGEILRKLSAARCARISYAPFDGNSSIEAELARYDTLVNSKPMHASPVEHQATPDRCFKEEDCIEWHRPELHGNFVGWKQNRKLLELDVERLKGVFRNEH